MALNGSPYKRICETLLLAYKYDELRVTLKGCTDIDLDNLVAQDKNYGQQLAELVEWADRQGRLLELLCCAYEGNKTNPQLASLWQDAQTWSLDAPQPPPGPGAKRARMPRPRLIVTAGALLVILAGVLAAFAAARTAKCSAFLEKNGTVVIEAEHFTGRQPGREHSTLDPKRSGLGIDWVLRDGVMYAEPDVELRNTMAETNGPALTYAVDFETPGQYQVYVRGYGANSDGDSIHIGLNGSAVTAKERRGLDFPDEYGEPRWVSRDSDNTPTFVTIPAAGAYQLHLWMRENGVAIDQIWLDLQKDLVINGAAEPTLQESPCRSEWNGVFG